MQRLPFVYVAASDLHGLGVYTAADITEGDVIEICPVMVFPADQIPHLEATRLTDYYFDWGENDDQAGLALGFGAIYNHSYQPNARYLVDYDDSTLRVVAIRPIEAGKEITFNYNGDPADQTKVWFE